MGIHELSFLDSPLAVVDFETTGLRPGVDRVIEIGVVRIEPGGKAEVALDTLINPCRPISGTEIHGITDADVASAPTFAEVSGDVGRAIGGCVVAAYNAQFDVAFLHREFSATGVHWNLPHVCLMYMRSLLGLGGRCRLADACAMAGVKLNGAHTAATDAMAAAGLSEFYRREMSRRGLRTFGELAGLGQYKFLESFDRSPMPASLVELRPASDRKRQRDPVKPAASTILAEYWHALCAVLSDLSISEEEVRSIDALRRSLGIGVHQVRALHARAFGNIVAQFAEDRVLDEAEVRKLHRLAACLRVLGYSPGDPVD